MRFGIFPLFLGFLCSAWATEADLKRLLERMEWDALELQKEVELIYQFRCNPNTLATCARNVYDNCVAAPTEPTCRSGIEFETSTCGSSNDFGVWYDYLHSTAILPADLRDGVDGNPTDPQVIETICLTQALDDYFIRKYEEDLEFWAEFGVEPAWMHFGSHTGVYRIFPGRQASDCGFFDPRNRPWYIAASSGPKNIVLALDVSGSMAGATLEQMKRAAIRVVNTLAAGDRVAIVPFSSQASVIADTDDSNNAVFFRATAENKEFLVHQIQNLVARGGTNFLDTFETTFKLVQDSIKFESHTECNSAILFLTDGQMTVPENVTDHKVIEVVNRGIDNLKATLGHSVTLFTYSVSNSEQVHEFPKKLACSTGDGIWSKIVDEDQIIESLNSYSQLFALGIGVGANRDFTTWVEPYEFFDMKGVPGVTVSAPVYDRSTSPHRFVGAVGIDFQVAAADKAFGVPHGSPKTLEILEKQTVAHCPRIELSICERESIRRRGLAGDEAMCTDTCSATDFVDTDERKCSRIDLPFYLWKNSHNRGMGAADRMCCAVELLLDVTMEEPSEIESAREVPVPIIASVVVLVVIAAICTAILWHQKRSTKETDQSEFKLKASAPPMENPEYVDDTGGFQKQAHL